MISINDYEVKIISNNNYDIKYKDSININKRFKPYKWYHFILFIWGFLKFYTEVIVCLSYMNSGWFWDYQDNNTQYGKDIVIYLIPKYLKKAIPTRELKISRSTRIEETQEQNFKFIRIEPIDIGITDNGLGELWDKIEINEEVIGKDFIYKKVGYKHEFSFDKFRNKLKEFFINHNIDKYLNCNYEKFEYKIFNSINILSDKEFIF